jgi:signal transduction histidine kinase
MRRGHFFLRLVAMLGALILLAGLGFVTLAASALKLLGLPGIPGDPMKIILIFVGLFVILVLLLSLLRRAFMPIEDLTKAAERVAEGDYAGQVQEHGTPEVRAIARAFNDMTERLRQNDQQRRNLLADVTHELRTPLTVIQGNLEGLLEGVYPRNDEHLEAILNETHLMSRLIEDLRTLSLAESGTLKLQKEPTDLAALIEETAESFQVQADQAGVTLTSELAPDLPTLELDAVRMREVLSNLILNALRYTPSGGRIDLAATLQGGEGVSVSISDTGSGIPPDDLPHIFDRFYKGRNSSGSGLGLAIAKNLVALHGGKITASSQVVQGTTVRFTLPLE